MEDGFFNASNSTEDIALVKNQDMEVDDDMEPAPENVPLFDNPASDTLFEVQTWGWDGIYFRDMVAQNQNEPSFKSVWITQRLYYINIFLHCLSLKWTRIVILPSTSRDTKEADIPPLTYGDILL